MQMFQSGSGQSSEPSHKHSSRPTVSLLYLESNKPDKQNVSKALAKWRLKFMQVKDFGQLATSFGQGLR